MRKPMIAGNWKMNKTPAETVALVEDLKKIQVRTKAEVVVCPMTVSLFAAATQLKGTDIKLGAQNVHFEDKGAFTGECNIASLKELGVEYVILGHSERRQYFAETDETVNKKVLKVLAEGLKPIVCVGESLQQKQTNITNEVVCMQMKAALCGVSPAKVTDVVIAYEPIWAIGTGMTATATDANRTIAAIRAAIRELFGDAADQVRILYGGSMNDKNATELMSQPEIDGGLIGGASLVARSSRRSSTITADPLQNNEQKPRCIAPGLLISADDVNSSRCGLILHRELFRRKRLFRILEHVVIPDEVFDAGIERRDGDSGHDDPVEHLAEHKAAAEDEHEAQACHGDSSLDLTGPTGCNDAALSGGDETQACHGKFARQNDHQCPGGIDAPFAEHGHSGDDKHLIGQRVKEFAEVRHLIAAARDLTVQNIGKTGHGKHDAGDDLHPAPDLTEVHTDQKNRDHHDTKQRDLRCSRHYAFSSISPTRSPSSAPVMRTITNSPGTTLRAAENSTRPSISGESA